MLHLKKSSLALKFLLETKIKADQQISLKDLGFPMYHWREYLLFIVKQVFKEGRMLEYRVEEDEQSPNSGEVLSDYCNWAAFKGKTHQY